MPYREGRSRLSTGSMGADFVSRYAFDAFLTFFGSQTPAFFFTTAPQSSHRYRPGLGLTFDFPFRQLMIRMILGPRIY